MNHLAEGMKVVVNEDVPLYGGEAGKITGWHPDGRYIVRLEESGLCEFWPHEITLL